MKQTALQELIEIRNKNFDAIKFVKYFDENRLQLLEKEKQQIINFGNKCQIIKDVDFDGNVSFVFDPEQYYEQTFKNE